MNEQIQKLIDITAESIPGVYSLEYESGAKGTEFTEEALMKFSELLIRECANQLDDGCDRGLLIKSILYQHFGIKE